ncbi:hypothetical protein LA080_006450 [Diaporthe eres]|nr:hypothetical protein LA080_006450 [Diaporthe eres]
MNVLREVWTPRKYYQKHITRHIPFWHLRSAKKDGASCPSASPAFRAKERFAQAFATCDWTLGVAFPRPFVLGSCDGPACTTAYMSHYGPRPLCFTGLEQAVLLQQAGWVRGERLQLGKGCETSVKLAQPTSAMHMRSATSKLCSLRIGDQISPPKVACSTAVGWTGLDGDALGSVSQAARLPGPSRVIAGINHAALSAGIPAIPAIESKTTGTSRFPRTRPSCLGEFRGIGGRIRFCQQEQTDRVGIRSLEDRMNMLPGSDQASLNLFPNNLTWAKSFSLGLALEPEVTTKGTALTVPGRRTGTIRPGEEISEEKPGPMDDTQHRVASGPSALNHGVTEGEHPSPLTRIPYPHPAPILGNAERTQITADNAGHSRSHSTWVTDFLSGLVRQGAR